MGPVAHVGLPVAAAYVLRLNMPIVAYTAIMPDIVDKSLDAVGIGGGRYIGHTLLFVVLVAVTYSLLHWRYSLSALIGGLSHLILDMDYLVPWLYPFRDYDFPPSDFHFFPDGFLQNYLSFSGIGEELILVGCVMISIALVYVLIEWVKRREDTTAF
ncbi:MAG: metal-dependent hydrolase [Chloroflexota bacterium]|nr:metal-dependent hydrolase [Chloroflexota bacterium]